MISIFFKRIINYQDMKSKIIILALASVLMMSCKKEFLEISPVSTVTVNLLYKTDKDYQDALVGCYRELQDFYDNMWIFGDLRGDDCRQDAIRSQDFIRVDRFVMDVNDDITSFAWRDLYQVISRTNSLLSKIAEAKVSIVPNKDQYIGEASFIRALAYFDLVRIFGDVPMIIAPISSKDALEKGRTAVDIIYKDVIIKDFLVAEANLPAKYSSTNVGRATKGAAKSLLGLVYLTQHDFIQAESKLRDVTTMGYSLLANWDDLFNFNNEHHSEYIFDIEYIDGDIGLGSNFTQQFLPEDQDVGSTLRKALVEKYNITSTSGGSGGTPNKAFIDAFDPLDLRKDMSVALGIFDKNGIWVPIPGTGAAVSAFTKKYLTSFSTEGKANWRVVRYADVLLMLAEALNENNKTDEALTYLNQVRTRAGLLGYSGLTQSDARDKILLERRFELYMEGHRWFDLVRTGRALSVMAPYGMKSFNTVFAIPQDQIEVINDPKILPQNVGY